jgi:hypothetical protein
MCIQFTKPVQHNLKHKAQNHAVQLCLTQPFKLIATCDAHSGSRRRDIPILQGMPLTGKTGRRQAMSRAGHAAGDQPHSAAVSGGPITAQIPASVPVLPRIERICGVRILRGAEGWQGVSLRLLSNEGEANVFALSLQTGNGHAIQVATIDEDDAVAAWRSLSLSSGLPMLVEAVDGRIEAPFPQLGRVALGQNRMRRSYNMMRNRRPRFLVRRKMARLANVPITVHGVPMSENVTGH